MLKAAIWGAGNIANTHADALTSSGIHIAAVVDNNLDTAKAFAEKWKIPAWGTDESILFADDITSVHVCTPPNLHYEMVSRLLDAKKHVLCEKPLCFENWQAEELHKKAKENKCVCAVNFNVRFHAACQKAKNIVQSKDFGPVLLVHGQYLQEFSAFPVPMGWRFRPELAGRMHAVTEIGTHWMDIIQFLSGNQVEAVSALFGKPYPTRILKDGMMYTPEDGVDGEPVTAHAEDMATIQFKMDNGAIGSVVLSEMSPGRYNYLNLEITGKNKNLWWNAEENNRLHTAEKSHGVNTEIFAFGNGFMDTFRSLVSEYYKAVADYSLATRPVYPDFYEGMRIVKICNAILASAENNSAWQAID